MGYLFPFIKFSLIFCEIKNLVLSIYFLMCYHIVTYYTSVFYSPSELSVDVKFVVVTLKMEAQMPILCIFRSH